jgi:hypothetical protein
VSGFSWWFFGYELPAGVVRTIAVRGANNLALPSTHCLPLPLVCQGKVLHDGRVRGVHWEQRPDTDRTPGLRRCKSAPEKSSVSYSGSQTASALYGG